MRDEVSGRWRIHDEELHNLKSSSDFIQTTTVKDEENGGGGGATCGTKGREGTCIQNFGRKN